MVFTRSRGCDRLQRENDIYKKRLIPAGLTESKHGKNGYSAPESNTEEE